MRGRLGIRKQLAGLDGMVAMAVALGSVIYGNSSRLPAGGLHRFLGMRITVLNAVFAAMFMLLWSFCFESLGLYRWESQGLIRRALRTMAACGLMSGVLGFYLEVSRTMGPTARIMLIFFTGSLVYEFLRMYVSAKTASRDPWPVIILGTGRRATKAWREIRTRYHGTVRLVGFVDNRDVSEMAPDIAARYLGTVDQLSELLLHNVVDELLIAVPMKSCYDLAQDAIEIAERVGVRAVYMQDLYVTKVKHALSESPDLFNDLVPFHEDYLAAQTVKRLVDFVGAAILICLFSPVFLITALAVKLTSRGPVLFVQERFGYRRRRFRMYKFRSMVSNAPELMAQLEAQNEATGPIFKMRHDPRVTRLGRFLRATSLDELPQLFNVLIGNMSMVGPRPMSVRDVLLFSESKLMRRFTVKPGITGLWQVSGRGALSFDTWIEMDIHYIDRWSLALDLHILLRTVRTVITRAGAV